MTASPVHVYCCTNAVSCHVKLTSVRMSRMSARYRDLTSFKQVVNFDEGPHRRDAPKCQFPSGSGPSPNNTWFVGPARIHTPNGVSIGSSVFVGLIIVTNRHTDRPVDHGALVTITRIFAMRPNNCTRTACLQHVGGLHAASSTCPTHLFGD